MTGIGRRIGGGAGCGFGLALLVLAASSPAHAKTKLAVMSIKDATGRLSSKVVDDLTDALRTRLAQNGRFIVIDKSRHAAALRRVVKEQKKQSYKDCFDERCQIPLGRALSADTLLRTKLSRVGSSYVINAELVDLSKEAVVGAAQTRADATRKGRDDRLLEAVTRLADQLAPPGAGAEGAPTDDVGKDPTSSRPTPRLEEAPLVEQADRATRLQAERAARAEARAAARQRLMEAHRRAAEQRQIYFARRKARGRSHLRRVYGWSLLASGALSTGLGLVGWLVSVPSKLDDVDKATSPTSLKNAADEVESARVASSVFFAAGVLCAAAGAYLLWTTPSQSQRARVGGVAVSKVPRALVLPGGGALAIEGRF